MTLPIVKANKYSAASFVLLKDQLLRSLAIYEIDGVSECYLRIQAPNRIHDHVLNSMERHIAAILQPKLKAYGLM